MNRKRKLANQLVPGSAIHPGVLLKAELVARKMKQIELARELGIAKNVMSEIINGKRNLTPDLAVKLETALGIDAEFWMKHQVTYQIDQIRIVNREATNSKTRLIKANTPHA